MKLVCPSCGDNLSYRVKEKDSFCPTCQMSFPIQEQPFDMQAFVCQQCSSCGAEIVSDDETRIVACEYCGGKEFQTVMFENGFHPVGIIPFQISEEEAKSIFYSLIKSAGKELENCVEMVQIQRFYVPYSYEYQFFDSHLNTFQKNLGKMDESDPQRIGNHHIYDPSLGTMKGIPSANHAMWRYYDYSQMLFQIQPFSIKKVKPLNPIYLDYACALNVKQEYVNEIVGSRKPEYYWVPIYKISFKAPPIENNVFLRMN